MKFRYKPTVIDAIRYESGTQAKVLDFLLDGHEDYSHLPMCRLDGKHGVGMTLADGTLKIPTLDGIKLCKIGYWVIKNGDEGEFDILDDELFHRTFEYLDHENDHSEGNEDPECHDCHIKLNNEFRKKYGALPA